MTLLSVRLRPIELRYDLIKSIRMYIWKCSIMVPENNKNWPCYETSKWHCKGQYTVNIYISKMENNYHMKRESFIFAPLPLCNWHRVLLNLWMNQICLLNCSVTAAYIEEQINNIKDFGVNKNQIWLTLYISIFILT